MTPRTRLILAGQSAQIEFLDTEQPARINFGGEQMLSVHQLIGGARIIDALGAADASIGWHGIFTTGTATERARFCDTLRKTGEPVTLTWGEFSYTGVIGRFHADYTRGGLYVPYHIELVVAQDNTAPVYKAPDPSPMAQVAADMGRATALSGCIGDSTLAGLNAALQTAVTAATNAIAPFARGLVAAVDSVANDTTCAVQLINQATDTVLAALIPVAQAQAQAQVLITSAEQAVTSITTAGGLLPGNPVAQMTGEFIQQTNAAIQLPQLYEYHSLMGRMRANLSTVASRAPATKQIQIGGGTLQQVAADQYGDASLWPVIAQANGLADPVLVGINTLTIPPKP